MNKFIRILPFLAFSFLALPLTPSLVQAASPQQRMLERVDRIDSLKQSGKVGENNRGYLEARGSVDSDTSAMISAENADRRSVYQQIAQKTGASVETVGRQRAQQIAARSAGGVWLQRPNGEWYRK